MSLPIPRSQTLRATWAVLLALCLINVVLGQIEFAGYDSSMLVDLAWRQNLGQLPYLDFPCLLPPAFYLLAHAAFALFGAHWWAFTVLHSIVWLSLAAIGILSIHRSPESSDPQRRTRLQSLFLTALTLPLLATNHLWHSATASELVVLLLLLLYLQPNQLPHTHTFRWLDLCLLFVYTSLWLNKPNTALPAILLSAWPILSTENRRRALVRWFLLVATSAALACLVLWACSISPHDVIHSYTQISGRPSAARILGDFLFLTKDWSANFEASESYAIVLVLLAANVINVKLTRKFSRTDAIAVIGLLITLIGFATNWDIRMNDLGPALFALSLPLLLERKAAAPSPRLRKMVRLTVVYTILLLAVVGIRRSRMQSEGAWAGDVFGKLSFHYDPFFGPFVARTALWQTLQIIDREHHDHPQAKLFFGPRLEYKYARLNLLSPRHLPLWWHPGSSYAISTEDTLAHTFDNERFDILIFASRRHAGYERIPPAIMASIARDFTCQFSPTDPLEICRRHP